VLAQKHLFLQVRQQWQTRASCRDMPLAFLSRDDVERLVALRFPEHRFPEELVSVLHAKTEGNPLFVADLLRYLRDAEILKQSEKAWILVRPLAEIEKEMPATVRSTIQLKVDGFSEADRKLLLAASVQGVAFDSSVLAKAVERDPAEVEERLQELDTVHDFVRSAGEQEFPDRTLTVRYRFVHVFYQNVLYASLTPSRRASLSRAIAEAILSFSGDKVPGLAADLAFLFESARDFARAVPFFLAASRQAAHLFAYPEAAILAHKGLRALETSPDSDDRAKRELLLSVTLGVALMATTGYASPEVERVHLRSRELCLRLGDKKRLLPTLWALYVVYLIRGELRRALEVAVEMQGPAETAAPADRIQALHAMGVTLAYMGRNREAREYLARILEQFDPRHHPYHASVYVLDPIITSQCIMGRVLAIMGELDQALAQVDGALERAQRLVHPQSLAYSTFWQAWIRHDRGEVDLALERADAALALCKEHGLYQIGAWARAVRGFALCAQGRLRDGVSEIRRSLEVQEPMHSALERPYCLAMLARGLALQGQHEQALKHLDEALALAAAHEDRGYKAEIHRLRGEVLLSRALENEATAEREGVEAPSRPKREDPFQTAAAAAFERAIAVAQRAEARTLELKAALSLFRLRWSIADDTTARAALAKALASFTEGRDTPHLAEARRVLGPA
jgi:tetratricopeptide (TPR) repeat protein